MSNKFAEGLIKRYKTFTDGNIHVFYFQRLSNEFIYFHYKLVKSSMFRVLFQELREQSLNWQDPWEEENGEAEEKTGKEKAKHSTIY